MIRVLFIITLALSALNAKAEPNYDEPLPPASVDQATEETVSETKNTEGNSATERSPALHGATGVSREPIQTPILNEEKGEELKDDERLFLSDQPFQMQEYRPNYFIWGKPDAKVQFSFKFKFLKNADLYFAYTQVMFWDLGEESNPFTEINYNPEVFYQFKYKYPILFNEVNLGYSHISNGRDGTDSRSVEEAFVEFTKQTHFRFGVPKLQIRLRYFYSEDNTNADLKDFYGPVLLRLTFTNLGPRLFFTEQFFVEYYNGGKYADDFSKSSVRLSFRFKLFESITAPKIFIQYFNGYGENLRNYNIRDESIRIGLSIGGQ